jgi:hypothetical protein
MTKPTIVQQIESASRKMTQTSKSVYLERQLSHKSEYFRKCYICLEEFRTHKELKGHKREHSY